MPIRELTGKALAFLVVAAALIIGGAFVLTGSHADNDYLNAALGLTLVGLGVLTLGYGVFVIGAIYYDARLQQQEAALHVTPRTGPPAPPPAWGMGDIGRPSVIEVGRDAPTGGGGTRVMSVVVAGIDAPLLLGALLVWTLVALIIWAPK